MFTLEPISNFCLILGYWSSKNASGDYNVIRDFVSLTKPMVLLTFGKRILCWSKFALELIADFCPCYWPSKSGSHDHDVKGEFASLAKSMVFGTVGKIISRRLFLQK